MRRKDPSSLEAIRHGVLFRLAEQYGWICWYCGIPLRSSGKWGEQRRIDKVAAHLDHVIPKCAGGSNDIENLALACPFCNMAKGGASVDEFLQWLDYLRFGVVRCPIRDGNI